MGDSEVEVWRTTLSRTVEAGASVSQPSHVVASVVLDILGESKLDLYGCFYPTFNFFLLIGFFQLEKCADSAEQLAFMLGPFPVHEFNSQTSFHH